MAVLEVAKIQVRSGLYEDLPALDTGEFGWCVDTQQLFIGKGTLAEGAPETGVTEILTQYSVLNVDNLTANIANITANIAIISANIANIKIYVNSSTTTLTDNTATPANVMINGNIAINISSLGTNIIDYNVIRGSASRVGTIKVSQVNGTPYYEDEHTLSSATGVNFSFGTYGTAIILQYTTTSTGSNATFNYYVKPFVGI